MNFFEPIEDSYVLLLRQGVYSESKLYRKGKELYAKLGSGYARLHAQNTTSVHKLHWKEIRSLMGKARVQGSYLEWFPELIPLAAE